MHRAEGRESPVLHSEFMLTVPSGRAVFVAQPGDTPNIVELRLVTVLEVKPKRNGKPKNSTK